MFPSTGRQTTLWFALESVCFTKTGSGRDCNLMMTVVDDWLLGGGGGSHSPRQMVPMEPLGANDLGALDAWNALRAALLLLQVRGDIVIRLLCFAALLCTVAFVSRACLDGTISRYRCSCFV
jgi:hypothetical protein